MNTCKLCGKSGGQELFYKQSRVRCKECTNRLNTERYHGKYRKRVLAARRTKHLKAKFRQIELSDVDRAYAAGLVDGEGSVRITERGAQGGTALRRGQYTLMVELTNTSLPMIDWLVARFGGSVSYAKANPIRNAREKWHWRVAANKALYVLDAVWPYLITKRQQAKLGRRFQRYAQYAGRAQTDKVYRLHQRFYTELRRLNARGYKAQMLQLQTEQ